MSLVGMMQLGFTYLPPFQTLFAMVDLHLQHWLPMLGGAMLIFLLVEAEKAIFRHRRSFRT